MKTSRESGGLPAHATTELLPPKRPKKKQRITKAIQNVRRLCFEDFLFLCEHVLIPFDFGPDFKLKGWHQERIREIGESVKNREPRRLDLWFRGAFKSCFVSRYSNMYRLLLRPDRSILLRHGDKEKATAVVSAAKKHFLHNPTFRKYFPDYCPKEASRDKWGRKDTFTLPNRTNPAPEPSFLGVGIDANLVGTHWDHISDDDIEHEQNVTTPELRHRLIRKWEDTPSLLVGPPLEPGTWNGVGTPWHADGLWVHIRNRFGEDVPGVPEARRIPVRFYPACSPGKIQTLVPDILTNDDLEAKLYDEGPYKFNANYRLTPTDPSDSIFREDWLRFHPQPKDETTKSYLDTGHVRRCITIDLAESQKGDMVAWAIIDIDPNGVWYARQFREERIDTLLLIRQLQDKHRTWAFDRLVVDAMGNQNYFQKWLKRENEAAGVWMSVTPVKWSPGKQTKHQRILALQARVSRGDFVIVEGAPGFNQFRHAALNYPHVAHDDLLDALALLEIVEPLGRKYEDVEVDSDTVGWWREQHMKSKRNYDPFVPRRRKSWHA